MVKRQWTILALATAVFLGISAVQFLQYLVSFITLLIRAYRSDWPGPDSDWLGLDWIEELTPLGIWLLVILIVAFIMIRRERAGVYNSPLEAGERNPKNPPRSSEFSMRDWKKQMKIEKDLKNAPRSIPASTYGGPRRAWGEKDPRNEPRSSPTYVDIGAPIKSGEETPEGSATNSSKFRRFLDAISDDGEIPEDSATSRPATEHVKESDEAAEEPSP